MLNFKLLSGKTALITGASKGIGAGIARVFAENGASLILLSRDFEKLEELKISLESEYATSVYIFKTDVSNFEEIKSTLLKVQDLKIGIDCLINNAGIMLDSTLMMMKPDVLNNNINTNLIGTINITQAFLKLLIRQRKGSIINMTSIIGTNGNSGQSAYSASKSAIIGFTKSISKELSSLNIRVNAISPGFIDTDLTKKLTDVEKEKVIKKIGMNRFGTTEDVAKLALFLASDLSDYITGQVVAIDGGMII